LDSLEAAQTPVHWLAFPLLPQLNVIMSNSRGPETLIDLVRELGDHA
jgi:hypothetical protein